MTVEAKASVDPRPMTDPQRGFLLALATERRWDHLDGDVAETIHDVLGNVGNPDPKFIFLREAKAAIGALTRCPYLNTKPVNGRFTAIKDVDTDLLIQTLAKLPTTKFALERVAQPGVFDFFEVVERRNGRRFLNRLVGSPGSWKREHLSPTLQLSAARHLTENVTGACEAYCRHHGTCCRCDAKLSDAKSIALAIGPVCRKKLGW